MYVFNPSLFLISVLYKHDLPNSIFLYNINHPQSYRHRSQLGTSSSQGGAASAAFLPSALNRVGIDTGTFFGTLLVPKARW
jgi:hypothetical protein